MNNPFLQVIRLLPSPLRRGLEGLPDETQRAVEEIRLRTAQPMTILGPWGEREVPKARSLITSGDLGTVLEIATQGSAHTALDRVRQGYFTVEGGHRIGICGRAVMKEGEVYNLRNLSSLSLRIARQVYGSGREVLPQLYEGDALQNTLILSPAGMGKTTLLRDLMGSISDGDGVPPLRVGVADERGELAAMWEGVPQFKIGRRTDVLDGCPKSQGLLMLLRGMNPQVLVADEITAPEDITALEMATNCGVTLLATAHGYSIADLTTRPLYKKLWALGVFQRVVYITPSPLMGRTYQVCAVKGDLC